MPPDRRCRHPSAGCSLQVALLNQVRFKHVFNGIARLADRGRIAPGLRADLLRVRLVDGQPIIRGIWVNGNRAV